MVELALLLVSNRISSLYYALGPTAIIVSFVKGSKVVVVKERLKVSICFGIFQWYPSLLLYLFIYLLYGQIRTLFLVIAMVVKIAIWIVGSHDFTILPHQNI